MTDALSDEINRLNGLLHRELEPYRRRVGAFEFELRHEQMGRSVVSTFRRDGVETDGAPSVTLAPYVKAAYRVLGRHPCCGQPVGVCRRSARATDI